MGRPSGCVLPSGRWQPTSTGEASQELQQKQEGLGQNPVDVPVEMGASLADRSREAMRRLFAADEVTARAADARELNAYTTGAFQEGC